MKVGEKRTWHQCGGGDSGDKGGGDVGSEVIKAVDALTGISERGRNRT